MFCPECGHEYKIRTNDITSPICNECRVPLKPSDERRVNERDFRPVSRVV